MTPQEASEELKEEFEVFKPCIHKADWDNPDEELRKIIEANTMAIEVLRQQSSEDCISRPYIEPIVEELENICINGNKHILSLLSDIKNAPSVTPKTKIGQWIEEKNDYGEITHWHCSKCYDDSGFITTCKWDYCPNCGADMRGEAE